jgi:hypothetical protein
VRELQLRDAGGFVFDLYRFGEQRDALVRGKLDALIATDKEIRSLEALLGVAGQVREIRQPGVGGSCANCGAFHASEASFCAHCGIELKTAAVEEPAPPEPDGEVTVAKKAGDKPSATEAPAPHGADPVASANGAPPAPGEVDPDTGEVAAVGHPGTER